MDEYDVDAVLQQALDRLTLLADAGSALVSTMDVREGLGRVCRIVTHRLGEWCAVDLLSERDRLERVCVAHRDPAVPARDEFAGLSMAVPDAAAGPLARVLGGAGPLLLNEADLPAEPSDPPVCDPLDVERLEAYTRRAARSAIIAPLRARRQVLGAITVARTQRDAPLNNDDLVLVEDLAHRVALAVDNTRLHQETEHIAERLQRSLLPALPTLAHFQMAARYATSQATAQVGGDWYDSFVLPKGDTTLIIGDVTGHDIQAAATMSQLRNMLRALACDRQEPPGEILQRLDIAHSNLYPESTTTCVYALIRGPERGPWELHHAAAGHPPPLLITAEGGTRFLNRGGGVLLGVQPEAPRRSAVDPLPPGSTVLLYTDGLVERRGESLSQGLTRLRLHAAPLAREPVDTICDELLNGLATPGIDDDVALLALRCGPAPDDHPDR